MYDADLYVAERSMQLYVDEAHREASRRDRAVSIGRFRPLARRGALLLVSAGAGLVRRGLPAYQPRSLGSGDQAGSPDGAPA